MKENTCYTRDTSILSQVSNFDCVVLEIFYGLQIPVATRRTRNRKCSAKKGVLKNFTKFTGKHLCQSLFLIRLQAGLKL